MTNRCAVYLATQSARNGTRLNHAHRRPRSSAAHPYVRHLLCGHLACRPCDLMLAVDTRGRPLITSPATGYAFSISHSGPFTALAVLRAKYLGVDVEQIRGVADVDDLSALVLASEEQEFLNRISPAQRHLRFLSLWVRKEACLKAIGLGLSGGLRHMKVATTNHWLLQTKHPDCSVPLFVKSFSHAGFKGAVASEMPVQPQLLLLSNNQEAEVDALWNISHEESLEAT